MITDSFFAIAIVVWSFFAISFLILFVCFFIIYYKVSLNFKAVRKDD